MIKNIKALLIKENEEDAMLFRAMLAKEKWGKFELEWKWSLETGIKRLSEGDIDVVLLDLSVPEDQGLEMLNQVLSQVPNLPLVVLTHWDDDTLGIKFLHKGAQDYLIKGQISGNSLARVMRYAIERKSLDQALRDSEERYRRLVELSPQAIAVYIDNKLVYINATGAKLFGSPSPETLWGKLLTDFVHPDDQSHIQNQLKQMQLEDASTAFIEGKFVRLNGEIIDIEATGAAITYQNKTAIQLVLRNVTERKQVEARMKASLEEKDVLLKEIHHRVKNNLQVISSLLDLQCRKIKDKQALNAIKESHNRVRSMALVHEKLYQSKDLAKIEFSDYIRNLAQDLFHSYGVNPGFIKLKSTINNVLLDVQSAIPCGLIINELVSNSLKYAFPGNKTGEIYIDIIEEDNCFHLIVGDTGVGIPEGLDFQNIDSLGLRLVNALVYQLKGKMNILHERGTEFRISFIA